MTCPRYTSCTIELWKKVPDVQKEEGGFCDPNREFGGCSLEIPNFHWRRACSTTHGRHKTCKPRLCDLTGQSLFPLASFRRARGAGTLGQVLLSPSQPRSLCSPAQKASKTVVHSSHVQHGLSIWSCSSSVKKYPVELNCMFDEVVTVVFAFKVPGNLTTCRLGT